MRIRLLLIVIVLLLMAAPVYAQGQGDTPTIPTLIDALQLAGTTVGAGMVISFLLTRVTWFSALTGDKRFWVVFALSQGVPLVATLIVQLVPASVLVSLEPYWQSLSAGFIVFIGAQAQDFLSQRSLNPKG